MNVVDIGLLVAVAVFAWSGWRLGFVAALLAFVGFIGGGIGGVFLAAEVIERFDARGGTATAITVGCIIGLALVGQVLGSTVGARIRNRINWKSARTVDQVGGAALNAAGLVVIIWILAGALAVAPSAGIGEQIRASVILTNLDRYIPGPVKSVVLQFRAMIDTTGLPQLFDSLEVFVPGQIEPPATAIVDDPEVQSALLSVVRVEGNSDSCRKAFTGSGFVFAPQRVITNAHVVAGVAKPKVHLPESSKVYDADTVYFDPKIDVAVLEVPELRAKPLPIAGEAPRGTDAIIAGYPGGGPMTATAARVRGVVPAQTAQGTDIYGKPGVTREIYVLRGTARPGNSGGPLIDLEGAVLGVIFAQAQDDPDTAYALTADQVEPAIKAGRSATRPVSTGACAA
ncbi:MAG: MarP family serine protease [Candidatus Nanopelagicales bacterium]|nr:MarP family serine protease [Candidatus Nanopelagicales bacterium]